MTPRAGGRRHSNENSARCLKQMGLGRDYFLKSLSNAARGSSAAGEDLLTGTAVVVSFSTRVRASKKEHSFRASFLAIRPSTGSVHSKRLLGSKWTQFLQLCSEAPHFRHWASKSDAS